MTPNRGSNAELPLLELDILRTIVAIVDTGNFSAAAQAVSRTPSAVSMQVKKAESLLGRPLFHRNSRSVTASETGELLAQHGRRMLALNREMMAQFTTPDLAGTVRLGAPDDMAERALPEWLRRFSVTHGSITVDVVIDNSVDLRQRVLDHNLDLALINCDPGQVQNDGVEVILREALTWAGSRHGVAYEQKPLPVSVWDESCAWRNIGLRSLEAAGLEFRIAYRSAQIAGQRAAVLADLAVAPIPISACVNGVVPLAEESGLPPLGDYAVGLLVGARPSGPTQAAADHIRAFVRGLTGLA